MNNSEHTLDCICAWCEVERQHAEQRFARFGEAMWKYITKQCGDFCGEEISEDILPLAQTAGLCTRVEYAPEIHGDMIDAEPGDEIWWWGDFDWLNA